MDIMVKSSIVIFLETNLPEPLGHGIWSILGVQPRRRACWRPPTRSPPRWLTSPSSSSASWSPSSTSPRSMKGSRSTLRWCSMSISNLSEERWPPCLMNVASCQKLGKLWWRWSWWSQRMEVEKELKNSLSSTFLPSPPPPIYLRLPLKNYPTAQMRWLGGFPVVSILLLIDVIPDLSVEESTTRPWTQQPLRQPGRPGTWRSQPPSSLRQSQQ